MERESNVIQFPVEQTNKVKQPELPRRKQLQGSGEIVDFTKKRNQRIVYRAERYLDYQDKRPEEIRVKRTKRWFITSSGFKK